MKFRYATILLILISTLSEACTSYRVPIAQPANDDRYNTAYNAIFSNSDVIDYFEGYSVYPVKRGVIVSERLLCELIDPSLFSEEIAKEFYPDIASNPTALDSLSKALFKHDWNCSDSTSKEIHNLSSQKTGQLLISFSRLQEGVVPGITMLFAHISSSNPEVMDAEEYDTSRYFRASLELLFLFDSNSDLIAVYSLHMEA